MRHGGPPLNATETTLRPPSSWFPGHAAEYHQNGNTRPFTRRYAKLLSFSKGHVLKNTDFTSGTLFANSASDRASKTTARKVVQSEEFLLLTKPALVDLLQRNLEVAETTIFKSVVE